MTGMQCSHAISCLRHEKMAAESIVDSCYSVVSFLTAYANNIWPCKDMSEWEKTNGPDVAPPVYEKKVGRPPKERKKQPEEVQGRFGPKLSKHGLVMHCGWCKSTEHNVKTCKLKKDGIKPPEVREELVPDPYVVEQEEEAYVAPAPTVNEPEAHWFPSTQQSTTMLSRMLSQVCVQLTLISHSLCIQFSVSNN